MLAKQVMVYLIMMTNKIVKNFQNCYCIKYTKKMIVQIQIKLKIKIIIKIVLRNFIIKQNKKFQNWKQKWKKKENSFINDIFEGALLTEILCLNCKHKALQFEKFGDLSLDMNRVVSSTNLYRQKEKSVPIQDLIHYNFKQEKIDDFKCERCKKEGIMKSHSIIQYPQILIVMIKRFVFFPQPQKLSQKVDFSNLELNLKDHYYDISELSNSSVKGYFSNLKDQGEYQLKGFINHLGDIDFGHYIAVCESQEEDGWYLFNDKKVKLWEEDNVINQSQKHVYVLFYERV